MDLKIIKILSKKYEGGLKRLAEDIDRTEANLHRCIKINSISATDLEKIAIRLNVDIGVFFDEQCVKYRRDDTSNLEYADGYLLALCKSLVESTKQRDDVLHQIKSIVKEKEQS